MSARAPWGSGPPPDDLPLAMLTVGQFRAMQEAERRKTEDTVRRLLEVRELSPTMDLSEFQAMIGRATPEAARVFLARHPSCPRQKAGRRLVFDRAAVVAWLEAHPARRGGGA